MSNKYIKFLLPLFLCICGCESLEDTYSDYSGDGKIRYLGKCTDISVESGWKRLIVKWTNNVDPVISNIKVTWKKDDIIQDTLFDKGTTECSLPCTSEGNYEVAVYGVDAKGNSSLAEITFGRPYTENHEAVLSFTRLIAKHFLLKKRLILFFSDWSDNVVSASLTYSTLEGEEKNLELTSELINDRYYLVPDIIDETKPIILNRKGRIEGCEDLIEFTPTQLSHDKLYTSDFKFLLRSKYGIEEVTNESANSIEELEIDYDISSLEDILNLPNLKKIVLGKNRYLRADMVDSDTCASKLYELERSLFVLNAANEINGLKVERYNRHYLLDHTLPFMEEKGNPIEPVLDFFDAKDWKISSVPEDENIDSHLEYLFNGNLADWWKPEMLPTARTHEITVDMNELKTIKGIRVAQKSFERKDDESWALLPGLIKVKVSKDQVVWEDATYVEENTLGATNGEKTIIYFDGEKNVRYLKFILNDLPYGANYSISLAEISVF